MTVLRGRDPDVVEAVAATNAKIKVNAKLIREISRIASELRRESGGSHRDRGPQS